MGWIIDIALIAITLTTILIYTFEGFVKSFLGSLKYVLALVIGYLLAKPVGAWISTRYLFNIINPWVSGNFRDMLTEADSKINLKELVDQLPDIAISFLDKVGFSFDSIISEGENSLLTAENVSEISASISGHVSLFISSAIAFLLVFILSLLLLSIAIFFLDKLFSTPGLKQINRGLGFLFGLICSFINLIVICSTITLILNIVGVDNPTLTVDAIREKTFIYRAISGINIFAWFL